MATTYYPAPKPGGYDLYGSQATPAPAAPSNLRQTSSTSSTASLAWDAVAGTYTLERATVTSGVAGAFSSVYTGATKAFTDGPLSFGATYAYRVKVAVGGVASGYSNVVNAQAAGGQTTNNYVQPGYVSAGYVS